MIVKKKVTYQAVFQSEEALKLLPPIIGKQAEKDKSLIKEGFVMDVESECDRGLLCEKILNQIDIAQAKHAFGASHTMLQNNNMTMRQMMDSGHDTANNTERVATHAQNKRAMGKSNTKKLAAITGMKNSQGFSDDRSSIVTANMVQYGGVMVSLENIVIANYVCDFGNVVVGNTKRKTFRLTNVGNIPLSFSFDKKIMSAAGISIDPDKVQRILPNNSNVFNVTYSTRKNAKFGKTKHIIPIDIK